MTVTDFYQNRNDLPKSSTQWVINRNKALASAGESIVAARKSLDQLDAILRGTVIRCHTNFRHPFNLSWSGKTCDIRRSSKTTS